MTKAQQKKEGVKIFFDNTSSAPRTVKGTGFTFYLDKIREMGLEFNKLEAFCTDGDINPKYPYQWLATTKHRKGEDDCFEGIAWQPLEAIRNLYKAILKDAETPYEEED